MPKPVQKPRSPAPVPAPKPKMQAKPLPKAVARPPLVEKAPLPPKPRLPTPRPTAADKRQFGGCIAVAQQRQRLARKRLDRMEGKGFGRVFGEKGDGPMKVMKELAMDVLGIALMVAVAKGTGLILGRLVGAGIGAAIRYVPEIETDAVRSRDAIVAANWRARPEKRWKPPVPTPAGGDGGDGMSSHKLNLHPKPKPRVKTEHEKIRDARLEADAVFRNPKAFALLAKHIAKEPIPENAGFFSMLMQHSPGMAAYVLGRDGEDFAQYQIRYSAMVNSMGFHPEVAAHAIFPTMVQAVARDAVDRMEAQAYGGGHGMAPAANDDGPAPMVQQRAF